ncbi:MAG: hypothetical protein ABR905_06850, partial [Terracidiphilus sp.]
LHPRVCQFGKILQGAVHFPLLQLDCGLHIANAVHLYASALTSLQAERIMTLERSKMPEQFENPQADKLEDDTVSDESVEKKIDRVAEKAAEKSSRTEQRFDKENSQPFSR